MYKISDCLFRWTHAGALSFLFLALLASGAVSLLVSGRWLLDGEFVGVIAGIVLLVVVFCLVRRARRIPGQTSDLRWLISLSLLVVAVRFVIITLAAPYEQVGDCRFMLDAIRMLVQGGFGDEVMLRLAGIYYDDYLWVGRSLPYLFPFAAWWPGHEVLSARVVNLVWSLLHNLMVYALARRLMGRAAARVAFALVSAIPVHSWMMLDYTHQYFGGFLVMAGLLILVYQVDDATGVPLRMIARGIVLGLVLIGLHFQSGIDRFLVLLTVVGLLLSWWRYGWRSKGVIRFAGMAAVALLLYLPVAHVFTTWLMQYRDLRMSSHPISFTARGWNVVTMGEYYGVYEQIDRETPWPDKPEAMKALILSQMAHEPAQTLLVLPVIKVAKYFLIGYATAIESQFRDAGRDQLASVFKGTRLFFTPVLLGLALWGTWRRLRDQPASPSHLLVILCPAVFCFIYLLAGETSPRYSFHVHGFIVLLAAGVVSGRGSDGARVAALRLGAWMGVFVLVAACAFLFVPPAIRAARQDQLFVNARESVLSNAAHSEGIESTIFTRTIRAAASEVVHTLELEPRRAGQQLSLFLWPQSREEGEIAEIQVDEQVVFASPLHHMRHVQRLSLDIPSGANELKVRVYGASGENRPLLQWGYVRYDSKTR